jgi:hypothetical protein
LRGSPSRKLFRPARRDNATSALKACLAFLARLDAPDENTIRLRDQLKLDVEVLRQRFFPGMTGR